MKKTTILILSSMMLILASGCKQIGSQSTFTADNSYNDSSSESTEPEESSATESNKHYTKVPITELTSSTTKTTTTTTTTTTIMTTAPQTKQTQAPVTQVTNSNNNSSNNNNTTGNSGNTAAAKSIYQSAIDMYSNVICGCPYQLNYDDTNANGYAAISDSNVTSTSDIVSKYCTVFTNADSYIYERYVEEDGKVYCNDASRGSNMYYSGTDLEYVSGNDSQMTYKAVSHYTNPETGEAMSDKTATFSIVMTDGGYKVSEFSYPK